MAERQGFEPWMTLLPYTRSRRANSTTLAPLLVKFGHAIANSLFKFRTFTILIGSKIGDSRGATELYLKNYYKNTLQAVTQRG